MQQSRIYERDQVCRSEYIASDLPAPALIDSLPDIPAMAVTRLQLDLLLRESSIDLSAVAEVILADPGATLQLLRSIGEEYPDQSDRPTRIEECIISLNAERWYEVICAASIPQDNCVIVSQWQHLRRVARCARQIAEDLPGWCPEQAYLVGLLHSLGSFPHLLGWDTGASSPREEGALGVMLAEHWRLPGFLRAVIDQQQPGSGSDSSWRDLLLMACEMTRQIEESLRQ